MPGFFFSIHWLLIAGIWYAGNGLLHDIFVLANHKGGYNRDLLRLLMDGHVLILSGCLSIVSWWMLKSGVFYGALIGLIVAIGMVVYCLLIYPFLRSFATLAITLMLAIACIWNYHHLSR